MNTHGQMNFVTGLPRSFAVQPMIPIEVSSRGQAHAAQPHGPVAGAGAHVSHGRKKAAHLPEHYRRYIILMLRSKAAQMPHPGGEALGHVLDPVFKKLCAHAVVLLERIAPEKLRPVGHFQMGEELPWQERLLMTMVFRLILRIADDGGRLHHRGSFWRLLRAVVPTETPQFNIPKFLLANELRLLKDIEFASYAPPKQLEATERRLDRWLSRGPVALRKQAVREPEAYRIAMLLSEQLGREARTMRLAIEERERPRTPASPVSPVMPTTPHWHGAADFSEYLQRQPAQVPAQNSYFDLKPPPMPDAFLMHAAAFDMAYTNGW